MNTLAAQPRKIIETLSQRWQAAVAVLFAAFALAALGLDDYPIYVDGLFSIATAGYFDPHSGWQGVLERLTQKSQQHVPGYFLVLHAWGRLVAWSPLALKLLSVFFGLISLALIYRLGSFLMGRAAGLCALLMLAALAFYNVWYLPIRMYTMFVAAALLLLWLYLRSLKGTSRRGARASRAELVALCLASVIFVYTHIFSLALFFGIGLYHVFFVAKTRAWWRISGVFLVAALAFSPWLGILAQGTLYAADRAQQAIKALGSLELLVEITNLGINASSLFLALLALAAMRAWKRDRGALALWLMLLATLAFYVIVNQALAVIDFPRLRYAVIVFPLLILLLVKGLEALPGGALVRLFLLAFWIASGMLFQRRVGAGQFVRSYNTLPIHLVERHLARDFQGGDLLTGWSDGLNLYFESVVYSGLADFYFARHGVEVAIEHTYELGKSADEAIAAGLRDKLRGRGRVWLVYELDQADRYEAIWRDALQEAQYENCRQDSHIKNVSVSLYQKNGCA